MEDALGDLLGDLMHWADAKGFNFELALLRARHHYEAERAEGAGGAVFDGTKKGLQ